MICLVTGFIFLVEGSGGRPSPITSLPQPSGPPAGPSGRLDLASLAPTVRRYFQAGLAPATQKSYQAAMRRFEAFCTHFNVTTPFPLTEHLMCCYASFLADEGLAPQTIKSYLSALRNMQLSLGFPDPREQSSLPMLKRIQAGIARCRLLRDPPSRIRLPITAHILRKIGQGWRESLCTERAVLWAVACSAFFGFFRLGELLPVTGAAYNPRTSLSWGDVMWPSIPSPTHGWCSST